MNKFPACDRSLAELHHDLNSPPTIQMWLFNRLQRILKCPEGRLLTSICIDVRT